jgi:HEPN domain-containing protein
MFGYTNEPCLRWLSQCNGDLDAAHVLAATPYYAQAGLLYQQSIEKVIKGVLVHAGEEPPRTHPLDDLLDRFAKKYPSVGIRLVSRYRKLTQRVTPFAVHYRYYELEPNFSERDLQEFAALAAQVRAAAWQFIKTHSRSGAFAARPLISSWTGEAVDALAERFGGAYARLHPEPHDRRLLTWLAKFRHAGSPLACCIHAIPEQPAVVAAGWYDTRIGDWWLLPDGRVLGVELPGEDFAEPGHYVLGTAKPTKQSRLRWKPPTTPPARGSSTSGVRKGRVRARTTSKGRRLGASSSR